MTDSLAGGRGKAADDHGGGGGDEEAAGAASGDGRYLWRGQCSGAASAATPPSSGESERGTRMERSAPSASGLGRRGGRRRKGGKKIGRRCSAAESSKEEREEM